MSFPLKISTTGSTVVKTRNCIRTVEGSILRRNERFDRSTAPRWSESPPRCWTPRWSNRFARSSNPRLLVAIIRIEALVSAMVVCPRFARISGRSPPQVPNQYIQESGRFEPPHAHSRGFGIERGAPEFESLFAHRRSPQCVYQRFESPQAHVSAQGSQ